MLNEMVLCEELFHTPSGVAFADFITEQRATEKQRDLPPAERRSWCP